MRTKRDTDSSALQAGVMRLPQTGHDRSGFTTHATRSHSTVCSLF